jgi:peptidoglycan/xylan/chitin deacetylase (PgdA/CDA1 family)
MADAEPRLAAGEAGGRPAGTISWGQLQAISDAGIEVGAHTVTHPQLDQLGGGRLGHELADCKALLQDRLGVAVTGMSYPFGFSDRAVRAATAAAGYRYACAVANRVAGRGDDRYAIPRITISRTTSPASFCRVIRGGLPPPEYLASRTLTKGYSVIRRSRSVLNRVWQ